MVISRSTYQEVEGYKFNQPSMTIPDQSLSVAEILELHTRGLPYDSHVKLPIWDEDYPDLDGLDLVEIQEMAEDAQNYASELLRMVQEGPQKDIEPPTEPQEPVSPENEPEI